MRPYAARERFDDLVLDIVTDIDAAGRTGSASSSTPSRTRRRSPTTGTSDTVPLSSLVRGSGSHARPGWCCSAGPIEHRCETRADLEAMVLTVVVEQVAELLGIDPELVDPRYTAPEE